MLLMICQHFCHCNQLLDERLQKRNTASVYYVIVPYREHTEGGIKVWAFEANSLRFLFGPRELSLLSVKLSVKTVVYIIESESNLLYTHPESTSEKKL